MYLKTLMAAVIFMLAAWPADPVSPALAASDSIQWYAYEEGTALAKKEHKKVYLHFWAEWCAYCKKMEKETFHNASVVAYLNRHFIAVKVNTDRETELADRFGVRAFPTTGSSTRTVRRSATAPDTYRSECSFRF